MLQGAKCVTWDMSSFQDNSAQSMLGIMKPTGHMRAKGGGRGSDLEAGRGHLQAWAHALPLALLSWILLKHMTQSWRLQQHTHTSGLCDHGRQEAPREAWPVLLQIVGKMVS